MVASVGDFAARDGLVYSNPFDKINPSIPAEIMVKYVFSVVIVRKNPENAICFSKILIDMMGWYGLSCPFPGMVVIFQNNSCHFGGHTPRLPLM